jgi:predicted transposase YdaD
MMTLPEELEQSFNVEITTYEEEAKMPYITPLERFAIEKGREEGREEGTLESRREAVIEILETRFTSVPASLIETINLMGNAAILKTLHKRAITIGSIAEFQQLVQELTQTTD